MSQFDVIVKVFDAFMDDKMHWRGTWSLLLHQIDQLGSQMDFVPGGQKVQWAADWQSMRGAVLESHALNGSIVAVRELIDPRAHSANFEFTGRPALLMNVNTDPSIAGIRLDLDPKDSHCRCAWCFASLAEDYERVDTSRTSRGQFVHRECVSAMHAWNRNYPELKI